MCSNSSPNHTAQLRTSSHNIQLRNEQLRDKAGTIAGKVVAAEGRVAKEGSHMMMYMNPCTHDDVHITKMCDTQEIHIWHISSHEYAHQDIHISQYIYIYIYISIYLYICIYIYIYISIAHQEIHIRHRVYGTPGIHISSHECAHTACTPGGAQASSKQVHIQLVQQDA